MTNQKEINEFMKLFKQEANKGLIIGEYVSSYQVCAIEDYGQFLANVGQENFQSVASGLAFQLKSYNSAFDGKIFKVSDKLNNEVEEHLNRSKKFRNSLTNPSPRQFHEQNEQMKNYSNMIKLLDDYIEDLEKYLSIPNNDIRHSKVLPLKQFTNSIKKSKKPIQDFLETTCKEYNIGKNARKIKILIDKLNEPPQ